jgi:lysophospholipase L1-like esterase
MDKQEEAWRFDWAAVGIGFRFQGSDFALLLEEGGSDFNVYVDGALKTIWRTTKADTRYEVNGLDDGEHRVLVERRNEPQHGLSVFKGLVLPRGGKLLEPGQGWHKQRRLEFLGASWTCGYGNEGPGLVCSDLRPVQNAAVAFPGWTARQLDAEYMQVAYSGRGLVRNYGDPLTRSAEPFEAFYGRSLYADPKALWEDKSWVPDAVVINLGGNDYSTEPHPPTEDFIAASARLMERVRKQYPKALIVNFISGGWEGYRPHIEAAVERRHKAGDKNTYVLVYEDFKPEELGCDYHPKAWGHRRLAGQLAPWLKEKLGW